MAFENIKSVVNATYASGFTAADANSGVVVSVSSGSESGFPEPVVRKSNAVTDDIAGVVQNVEVADTGNRAPSGRNALTYANSGVVKVKKSAAPDAADVGSQIRPTTTAGEVSVNADAGFGMVVDITGTTTDDYLLVDLDRAVFSLS